MNHFQFSPSRPTNCAKPFRLLVGKKLLGFRASKACNHNNVQLVMRSMRTVNDGKMAMAKPDTPEPEERCATQGEFVR
jgi:hypothetical protein